MDVERESLSELQDQRIGLETKLTRAQTFLNNSGRLDFRIKDRLILDPQDPNYAEKTIKLGVSRRRLRESVIPSFQTELSIVDGKINSFVINETLVSRRYQLQQMQELVLSGDLTEEHIRPIVEEITNLESQVRIQVTPIEPAVEPVEPEGQIPPKQIGEETDGQKADAKRRNRENREKALNMILDNTPGLTPEAVIQIFGRTSSGRNFSWPQAKSSIVSSLKTIYGRIKLGTLSKKDRELKDKFLHTMGKTDDQDFSDVISVFEHKLIGWFKGERALIDEVDDQPNPEPAGDAKSGSDESKEKSKRILTINLESRTIQVGEADWVTISADCDWNVLRFFAQNPRRKVWLGEQALVNIARAEGYVEKRGQTQVLRQSIQYLSRLLKVDSDNLIAGGKDNGRARAAYTLNVDEVHFLGREVQNTTSWYDVVIPGGLLVRAGGDLEVKALRAITTLSGNNFNEASLSKVLFGNDDNLSLRRTRGVIRRLNMVTLVPYKLEVTLIDDGYKLGKVQN